MDPRFFTPDQIALIHVKKLEGSAEWSQVEVPNEHDLKLLKTQLGKKPFNSLKFPEGLGPDWIEDDPASVAILPTHRRLD
jgi:hypothetical protein